MSQSTECKMSFGLMKDSSDGNLLQIGEVEYIGILTWFEIIIFYAEANEQVWGMSGYCIHYSLLLACLMIPVFILSLSLSLYIIFNFFFLLCFIADNCEICIRGVYGGFQLGCVRLRDIG